MTKEEILEGNKLIVKFLDIKESKLYYDSYGIPTTIYKVLHKLYSGSSYNIPDKSLEVFIENCKYHTSWDWLMPCVEKINQLNILKMSSNLGSLKMKVKGSLYGIGVNNTIEDVWEIVVLFIKTYNEKLSE